ncbi:MAG: recombination mediator RecR [Gammaproteobacteria bacterium]
MTDHSLIFRLVEAFRCLPGVGPKSAQRMSYHLLERDKEGAKRLANSLLEAVEKVGNCKTCRTLTELDECHICSSPSRDRSQVCIVETPADVNAINHSADYKGLFFVLSGHLSPLDGVGPAELGLDKLSERLASGNITEVIIATNPTVEGEATAHYLADMAHSYQVKATRIAYGVPIGGELEYVDSGTLSHSFSGRKEM